MTVEFFLYHAAFAGIAVLLTQSLNLVWRVNRFSLGHHGYFGIGAYAGVVFTRFSVPDGKWALDTWIDRLSGAGLLLGCIGSAAVVTGFVGYVTIRLFVRLREDHFAVATLVFAEIVQNVAANCTYVGGALGFEAPYLAVRNAGAERLWYVGFYASLGVALNLLLYLGIRRLDQSTYGLYITASRDDELAAELCGVDVWTLQRTVFLLATAVAGAAGALFLHFTSLIVPGDFSLINGLPIILYVVLGNLGPARCVAAALGLYTAYEIMKLQFFGLLGLELGRAAAEWKEVLLASVLIAAGLLPALLQKLRCPRREASS
ncbi:MAG: branched-chain amino acid ABC transporter permease [Planctomycetes bacterium]|nr:branched-chain amino acid ABC transporter permease [Planctomycetota bacterium]